MGLLIFLKEDKVFVDVVEWDRSFQTVRQVSFSLGFSPTEQAVCLPFGF